MRTCGVIYNHTAWVHVLFKGNSRAKCAHVPQSGTLKGAWMIRYLCLSATGSTLLQFWCHVAWAYSGLKKRVSLHIAKYMSSIASISICSPDSPPVQSYIKWFKIARSNNCYNCKQKGLSFCPFLTFSAYTRTPFKHFVDYFRISCFIYFWSSLSYINIEVLNGMMLLHLSN